MSGAALVQILHLCLHRFYCRAVLRQQSLHLLFEFFVHLLVCQEMSHALLQLQNRLSGQFHRTGQARPIFFRQHDRLLDVLGFVHAVAQCRLLHGLHLRHSSRLHILSLEVRIHIPYSPLNILCRANDNPDSVCRRDWCR